MSSKRFLEIDPANVNSPDAPYAVLPVPYERTVCFGKGTAAAPAAILAASNQLELFDEELLVAPRLKVQTLPEPDCACGNEEQVLAAILQTAQAVLQRGRFLMTFGGEHTISFPLVKAAQAVYRSLSVLQFDAHLDLRRSYQGNTLSHACVMRRVMELGVPVVPVGIRSLSEEEFLFVRETGVEVFWARDVAQNPAETWLDRMIAQLKEHVYITIDSDCLDPSIMPGTGTPEPGGLSWYALTHVLRQVCAKRKVIAADVVEVIPLPGTPVCEYVAARLACKLLTYHSYRR